MSITIGNIVKLTSQSPYLDNPVYPSERGEVIRLEERDGLRCAVVEFEDVIIHCPDGECINITDTDEIQTLRGKGPRNGQYVGAVAICQALRRLGCSYSQISSIVGSSERTVWNHVHAYTGSNVAPWGRRSLEARSRAMQVAAILVRECHMTPRGTTC